MFINAIFLQAAVTVSISGANVSLSRYSDTSELLLKPASTFPAHNLSTEGVSLCAAPEIVTDNKLERLTLRLRMPSGRMRGRSYLRREYTFSKEGGFVGSSKLEDFTALKDGASE
ncbi:MAG TPA: hypothetical protein VFZ40_07935 [Pyrinomonadaceae bacterium]